MTFLALFGIFSAFGLIFPRLFKAFYWLFMLPLWTFGPAVFIYLGAWIFGADLPYSTCCVISFVCLALPFMKWTAPE